MSHAVGRSCHAPSGHRRPPELGPRPRARAARAAAPGRRALDPTPPPSPLRVGPGPVRSAATPHATARTPTTTTTTTARPGPLHPTRQGPSPAAGPGGASRPHRGSIRGIVASIRGIGPPRGQGRGLDMSRDRAFDAGGTPKLLPP
ncbi:MAG: hypothetical protein JO116_08540 [Planctomycetaceae bacterium]|nr:hypothetical protein [Planctomycetaceae bacterium]